MRRPTFDDHFWSQVAKGDGCWEWQSSRLKSGGYGQTFQRGRGNLRAHRVAWELTYGPIPAGLYVCHRCDNPPCCRPSHLFLGSHRDNMHDSVQKGRAKQTVRRGAEHWANVHPERRSRGPRNGATKLTADQVLAIRAAHESGESLRVLGDRYGVTRTAIFWVCKGKNWAHV